MTYENILLERPIEGVGVVRLNRPNALNALNNPLMKEVHLALREYDNDPTVGCMIITGSDKAFAAGADIKEMLGLSYTDVFMRPSVSENFVFNYRKPVIAAVSGFALGGGCELAMACDMMVVSESAVLGQPEINLGILPGGGGTQRLTRAVGKALAMEIMLSDRRLTAQEAVHYGLANRIAPVESYFEEAVKLASKIANMSQVAVRLTKDAILQSYETTLAEGVEMEKRNFWLAFGTQDKQEGMQAFVEKRKPTWKNE